MSNLLDGRIEVYMKTLIMLLCLFALSFAQYGGYGVYNGHLTQDDGCTKYIASDANTLASWIFDDVNNSTPLTDLSGNGNTLTPSAGFDYANQFTGTSMFCNGTSLKFDGVDDYFSIGYADATDLDMGTGDITIEALFTTTSDVTSFQPVCIKNDNNAIHKGYMIFINGGNLIFRIYDGSGTAYVANSIAASINTDYYVAMSVDRNGEQFGYVNGSKVWTQSTTNSVDISSNYNFYIGTDNTITTASTKSFMQVVLSSIAKSEADVGRYYYEDYTGPTILAYTATGVQYDSVQHIGSFTAESGAYYGIFIAQDTTETNLVGSWLSLVDFDTTLYHHVSQTTNQTFYLVATDNLDNVSWASDAATIEDTPDTTPPGAGTIVAEFLPNFQIGLTWNYADDADSVKVYLIEEDNPDSVLATTATTGTTGDTIDIPLTLKFAGNDNLYAKKYSWDASNNKSAAVVYTIPPSYFTMWVDTSDTNIDSLTYGIAYRYPGGINDSVANMQDSLTTDTTYIYHEDYANLDGSGDSLGLTFPDTNAIDTSWYAVRWNVDGVRQDTLSNWAMWPEAGSSTTYLVNQNFEGTGYDNGETWTESVQEGETSTRYVNEDYTTAPLAGSQSLEMRSDSYQVASVVTSLATASSSVSLSFKMNKTTGNPTDQVYFIEFLDASDNILSY